MSGIKKIASTASIKRLVLSPSVGSRGCFSMKIDIFRILRPSVVNSIVNGAYVSTHSLSGSKGEGMPPAILPIAFSLRERRNGDDGDG